MIPSPISPDTKSDAERLLYAAFHDSLSDDYVIFQGVAWQSLDAEGRPRDGEADFVIAHPRQGVLVVEVKGGATRWNPADGEWTSTSRGGRVSPIHNPFNQAKDSKYALRDAQRIAVLRLRPVTLGHAVAFPDVVVGTTLLGADKPRNIVLDKADLADVAIWVARAMRYWQGDSTQQDAPMQMAVMDALANPRELRPALWGDIALWQKQLIQLIDQQFAILNVLNRQCRAKICGCAGSGKIMPAAEKATRLAARGFRVLLTCFSLRLAQELRERLKASRNLH